MEGNQALIMLLSSINNKLSNIQADIRATQQDVKSLRSDNHSINAELEGMKFAIENNQAAAEQSTKEMHLYQEKVDMLTSIVRRYEDKISNLMDKCNALEAKNMKPELIIFGLQESEEKVSALDVVKDFFTTEMELTTTLEIQYAYWKGKGKNRPIVVRFTHGNAKGQIFGKVSNLKGKKNAQGKAFRIADHLPEELAEVQCRQSQIIAANKQLATANQQSMVIKKGVLFIANNPYRKRITPPRVPAMMDFSDQMRKIKEITISETTWQSEKGSRLLAVAAEVTNLSAARNVILHVRKKYAGATHVSVAYRIAGLDKAYDEDYFDDGEHSMGRRLLDLLFKKDVANKILLVVRFYGGTHIGNKQFEIAMAQAQLALDNLSEGLVLQLKLPLRCLITQSATQIKCRPQKQTSPSHMLKPKAKESFEDWCATRDISFNTGNSWANDSWSEMPNNPNSTAVKSLDANPNMRVSACNLCSQSSEYGSACASVNTTTSDLSEAEAC